MSEEFQKVISGFLQAVFHGDGKSTSGPDFAAACDLLGRHRTLQARSVLSWPSGPKEALRAMLTEWVIVICLAEERGDPLPIPQSWLQGSSSTRLNEQIVAEILHRSDALISQYRRRTKAERDRREKR